MLRYCKKGGNEEMTISIRLTEDEEKVLQRLMEQTGLAKTQLIKRSLFMENPVPIVDRSREIYMLLHHIREELEKLESTQHIKISDNIKEELWEICQKLSV